MEIFAKWCSTLSLDGVAVAFTAITSCSSPVHFISYHFRLIHSFSTSFCYHSVHSKRISNQRYSIQPSSLIYSPFRLFVCLFMQCMGLVWIWCVQLVYEILLVVYATMLKNSVYQYYYTTCITSKCIVYSHAYGTTCLVIMLWCSTKSNKMRDLMFSWWLPYLTIHECQIQWGILFAVHDVYVNDLLNICIFPIRFTPN